MWTEALDSFKIYPSFEKPYRTPLTLNSGFLIIQTPLSQCEIKSECCCNNPIKTDLDGMMLIYLNNNSKLWFNKKWKSSMREILVDATFQ